MYFFIRENKGLVELIVLCEINIPKDHAIKINKYEYLINGFTKERYVVKLYAVEVKARDISGKSFYMLLKT